VNIARSADIFESLKGRTGLSVVLDDGRNFCIVVNAIEVEDGSGRSFNVRAHDGRTFYVRTRD
jgi:hypothetical protein